MRQNTKRFDRISQATLLFFLILACLVGGLIMWWNWSTNWMESNLNAQWRIKGEGSESVGVSAFAFRVNRNFALGGGFELGTSAMLVNLGEQDLDITNIRIQFIDEYGNLTDQSNLFEYNYLQYPYSYYDLPQMGIVLPGGDSRPLLMYGLIPLHDSQRFDELKEFNIRDVFRVYWLNLLPSSMNWREAVITVTVRPADLRVSTWYQTWTDHLVITKSERLGNKNFYHIEGYIQGYDEIIRELKEKYENNKWLPGKYTPSFSVLIGLYDLDGNFLAYDDITLDEPYQGMGGGGQFAVDYYLLDFIPHGKKIAEVKPLLVTLVNVNRYK